jgi:DNA-binding CsgD family transcriptional regulator
VTARVLGARPLLSEIEILANRANVTLPDGGLSVCTDFATRDNQLVEPKIQPSEAPSRHPRKASDPLSALTPRERAVLAELADGRTNRQIARRLFIAEKTVSVHVSHIFAKLGLQTRVQAGALMYRVQQAQPDLPDSSSRRGKDGVV